MAASPRRFVVALLVALSLLTAASASAGNAAARAEAHNPLAFSFDPAGHALPLKTAGGAPIKPGDVARLYGTPGGFAIYADGVDVCSWDYARLAGFTRPRKPVYQDLADKAGWPDVHVVSGTLAVDPATGRFKFAEGDVRAPLTRVSFLHTPHGTPLKVCARGNYVYVPNGETWAGIQVVDTADPARPRLVQTFDAGCFGKQARICGDRLYALANYHGITIIDIADPARPVRIGYWRVPPPSVHTVLPFDLNGKKYFYSFVTAEGNWKDWPKKPAAPVPGVRLVDATDAGKPVVVALLKDFRLPELILGRTAFTPVGNTLVLHDVADPARPAKLATLDLGGRVAGLCEAGKGRLYATVGGKELVVLDVQNPRAPRVLGRSSAGAMQRASDVAAAGDACAYVVDAGTGYGQPDRGLHVFRIDAAGTPSHVGHVQFERGSSVRNVTVSGDRAYAMDANYGFWILDIKDRATPRVVGIYHSAGEIEHLLVSGARALASLEWGGMEVIIDLTRLPRLSILGIYRAGRFDDYADAFLGDGRYFYFGKGPKDKIVDITDPAHPREIGVYPQPEAPFVPVRLWADRGYVIGSLAGKTVVSVYDYRDPLKPVLRGRVALAPAQAGPYHALVTDGRTAWALQRDGLLAVDVSDPAAPRVAGFLARKGLDRFGYYRWQGSGRRLACARGYVYMLQGSEAADDPHLSVIDARDPAAMKLVYTTPESTPTFQDDWFDSRFLHQRDMWNDMVLEGRYLYVSDYWGGVRVFDLSRPEAPRLADWEFTPYLALVPKNWSRALYKQAVASGDVHKFLGLTPERWQRRFGIGHKLSWAPFEYYPGYELFGWNIGELVGDYLLQPKLTGVAVYRIKRSPETPVGPVTVRASQ